MTPSLRLYGFVGAGLGDGDSITAKGVADELDQVKGAKALDIFLSSGGGSVIEGLAIYEQIHRFPGDVTIHVDGVAASISSLIAVAGKRLVMPKSSMLMIHRPWNAMVVAGNSAKLREQAASVLRLADDLEVMNDTMRAVYAEASGLPSERVQGLMDAETWLTADQAKSLGFADEIGVVAPSSKAIATRSDLRLLDLYQNTPTGLRQLTASAALSRLEGLLMRQRVQDIARGASAAAAQAKHGK